MRVLGIGWAGQRKGRAARKRTQGGPTGGPSNRSLQCEELSGWGADNLGDERERQEWRQEERRCPWQESPAKAAGFHGCTACGQMGRGEKERGVLCMGGESCRQWIKGHKKGP